jgi:hypothetical protein
LNLIIHLSKSNFESIVSAFGLHNRDEISRRTRVSCFSKEATDPSSTDTKPTQLSLFFDQATAFAVTLIFEGSTANYCGVFKAVVFTNL